MWSHVNIHDFLIFLLGCWFAGMVYVFYGGIVERKYWHSEGELIYLVFASFFWPVFIVVDWLKELWKKYVGYQNDTLKVPRRY